MLRARPVGGGGGSSPAPLMAEGGGGPGGGRGGGTPPGGPPGGGGMAPVGGGGRGDGWWADDASIGGGGAAMIGRAGAGGGAVEAAVAADGCGGGAARAAVSVAAAAATAGAAASAALRAAPSANCTSMYVIVSGYLVEKREASKTSRPAAARCTMACSEGALGTACAWHMASCSSVLRCDLGTLPGSRRHQAGEGASAGCSLRASTGGDSARDRRVAAREKYEQTCHGCAHIDAAVSFSPRSLSCCSSCDAAPPRSASRKYCTITESTSSLRMQQRAWHA